MKILFVFGTRPEAIKMCPLIVEMRKTKELECVVCLTGQHREMLNQVMESFQVSVDYNFDIMKPGQSLAFVTSRVLEKMEGVLGSEHADLILVHGDTTSSLAAALAGFYKGIPIGHVEAGLRTHDMQSPYPEEFNRQAVDLITDLYFAPTELAKKNLLLEGKTENKIFVTGNTVIDALKNTVSDTYKHEALDWAGDSRLILFTAHRRENIGSPMRNLFRALKRVVQEIPDIKVIYPIHKNPKVRELAHEILGSEERIRLIEPLDVIDFHNFMAKSYLIMTDSGGIQEEAPSLGKPVLVMRDTTERPEGVAAGTLELVGTEEGSVYRALRDLLSDKEKYDLMSRAVNPYGDGRASKRIVQVILEYFAKMRA